MTCESCGLRPARFERGGGWLASRVCPICAAQRKVEAREAGEAFTLIDLETGATATFEDARDRFEHATRWYESLRDQGVSAERLRAQRHAHSGLLWECLALGEDGTMRGVLEFLSREGTFLLEDTDAAAAHETPLAIVQ